MEPSPWSWDPAWDEIAVVLVMTAAYAVALTRYPASRVRVAAFLASQLLVLAVFATPIGTLSLNYLLSAHFFQNVALAEWAPALAVLGLTPAMASALARFRLVRVLTRPLVALPLWLLTYAVWHIPVVYDAALRDHLLLHLEHATYFATGLLLWWPVFHDTPSALSSGAKAAYLFSAFFFASPLGLLIALVPTPVYAFYEEAPRVWGLSPLTDQEIAGVLMAGSEAILFFSLFAFFFVRLLAEEERR